MARDAERDERAQRVARRRGTRCGRRPDLPAVGRDPCRRRGVGPGQRLQSRRGGGWRRHLRQGLWAGDDHGCERGEARARPAVGHWARLLSRSRPGRGQSVPGATGRPASNATSAPSGVTAKTDVPDGNGYERLARDDLATGGGDTIAAETVQALNNSDLFAVSPNGAWLAVAAGSGVIGEASSTAITVKHLSPPARAAAP